MITCPHCGASWVYQGDDENTTPADDEWLDWHYKLRKCQQENPERDGVG